MPSVRSGCSRRSAARLFWLLSALPCAACQEPDADPTWVPPYIPHSGCTPSRDYPVSARNLEPGERADYIAVEAPKLVSNGQGGSRWSIEIVDYAGQQCADPGASCIVPLRATADGQGCAHGACDGIITRHGTRLRNVPLRHAADVLAPIDTPAEALLIVRALGYDVTCEDVSGPAADGSYQVSGRKDSGDTFFDQYCTYVPVTVQGLRVAVDGSVAPGETSASRRQTGCARIQ